jgi:hypothetical protein
MLFRKKHWQKLLLTKALAKITFNKSIGKNYFLEKSVSFLVTLFC